MTSVVKLTPAEERAERWCWIYPVLGLGAMGLSAALVLWPLALWFLDQDVKRQGEIIEAVVGAVIVMAAGLLVVEGTARVDRRWRP